MYPIAEIFHSIQGEGQNCGIPMSFVRLAGCNVGKPVMPDVARKEAVYQDQCTSWDGTKFMCDTNYRMREGKMSILQILARLGAAKWVSITGGEPFVHDIYPLIESLWVAGYNVHVETSGTINIDRARVDVMVGMQNHKVDFHLVCSPKEGYEGTNVVDFCDEVRLLVDKNFSEAEFLRRFPAHLYRKLWLSPVNNLLTLDINNVKIAVELVKKYRGLRLTTQMHKVWGVE